MLLHMPTNKQTNKQIHSS